MKPEWRSIVAAFLAAAVSGAFVFSLETAALVALGELRPGVLGAVSGLAQLLFSTVTGVLLASPVFLIGLVVVGGPAWLIVNATWVRSRIVATILGAGLAGSVATIILALLGLVAGGAAAIGGAALILPGAAAGWTLHRVAYGRNPNP